MILVILIFLWLNGDYMLILYKFCERAFFLNHYFVAFTLNGAENV